ncbi:MAG: bifunctional adenosylcobinamide kinase/adenosylcobinamide-phosphate guanylyltransferase [Blautia sp.]|nr:bifunctional adenosylcobinamide kinase/adenosylcobinamide-phosphate guanylyltransferase [Blautia sp.]
MMVLVTGGSGSGKSAYAENRVMQFGDGSRIYIATMFPFDEESHRRIARHRKMREGKGFTTKECYTGLKNLELEPDSVVLLECMSNLTANEMFQPDGAGERTVEEILKGILTIREKARHLVVVTNEIFSASASYDKEMETYLDYLGCINQEMAEMADEVTEVVYGIPVFHKGGKKDE